MTKNETNILIQKYLNAETTPDEEKQLALEVSREDAPEEWKIVAEMLGELTTDEALFDQIMAERKVVKMSRKRRLWPLAAAACVAGILALLLTPPKTGDESGEGTTVAQVDTTCTKVTEQEAPIEELLLASTDVKGVEEVEMRKVATVVIKKEEKANEQMAESMPSASQSQTDASQTETPVTESTELLAQTAAPEAEKAEEPKPRILTERDIPITRPENYKYTKEEIALMKKQANEAYLKWVELEIEISKYNLENTAER